MSEGRLEYLAELLECAMGGVVITRDYTGQLIDLPTYRQMLRRCWDRHWPSREPNHPRHYSPNLLSKGLRECLIATVSQDLAENIHEGRVQTAAIATVGGYGGGFTLDDLAGRLVEVAIARGPRYAANAFYQGIREDRVAYRLVALLTGVRLEHDVHVRPGVQMIALPGSSADLPPLFPDSSEMTSRNLLEQTLILVDLTVQPMFANPASLALPDEVFQRRQVCTELPDFNVPQFCEALSLANNGPIACVADWIQIDPDAIFNPRWPYTGPEYHYPLAARSRGSVTATPDSVEEAVSLYQTRKSLSAGPDEALKVPIKRWIKSKADQSLPDRFIDLRIALESLYLRDFLNESSQEMRFRLSLFGAWHLGSELGERRSIRKRLREAYDVASGSVHTGVISETEEKRKLLSDAQELCRRGILKLLREESPPDWGDLILGAGEHTGPA